MLDFIYHYVAQNSTQDMNAVRASLESLLDCLLLLLISLGSSVFTSFCLFFTCRRLFFLQRNVMDMMIDQRQNSLVESFQSTSHSPPSFAHFSHIILFLVVLNLLVPIFFLKQAAVRLPADAYLCVLVFMYSMMMMMIMQQYIGKQVIQKYLIANKPIDYFRFAFLWSLSRSLLH